MLKTTSGAPRQGRTHSSAILAAAALAAVTGGSAFAQTVPPPNARQNDWIGPATPAGGSWHTAVNWSYDDDGDPMTPGISVVPSTIDNHFATINNNGLAIVNGAAEAAFLTLGTTYRGPGDFDQGHLRVEAGAVLSLGELRVGGRESLKALHNVDPDPDPYLQDGGIGTVLQIGGTVNVTYTHGQNPGGGAFWEPPVQSMYVGDSAADRMATPGVNHAEGTYQINAGTLNVGLFRNDQLVIGTGLGTKGTFIQQGGDVTSSGTLLVARRGAIATYTISGGTLTVHGTPGVAIGDGETAGIASTHGTFTQTGGTVNVRSDVRVGRRNGTGIYNMSSGTLNIATADSIYTGVDIVPAGTLNIGSLGEGTNSSLMNSTGTFNLSGDAVINIGQLSDGTNFVSNLNVGLGNTTTPGSPTGNRGFLEMTGGTINMHRPGAFIVVGNGAGVVGTANVSAGTINNTAGAASTIDIGRNSGGGTLTLSGTGVINTSQLSLNSGSTDGATRAVVVNGGTLNADVVTFGTSNSRAARSFKVTGGTVDVDALLLGAITNTDPDATSLAEITGGAVSIGRLTLGGGSVFKLSNMNMTIPGITIVTSGASNIGNFDVAAGNTLTLAGGVTSFPETTIPIIARGFRTTGAGTLTIQGTQSYEPLGTTLHHNTGTLNVDSNANGNLTINANSTTNLNASQRLNALNVGAGATTTLLAGGDKTLHVNTLTINSSGGKLDMKDNDLLIEYAGASPEAQVRQWVRDGRAAGSTSGIFVTPGSPADDKVLAIADNAEWGKTSFGATPIVANTVVGKYTYFGDSNLDGAVTGDDYLAVDSNLGTGTSWIDGDFNLDNSVTGDDYLAIDTNLGKGTPNPLAFAELKAEMVALHVEMFGEEYLAKLADVEANGFTTVPEPGTLSVIGLGAAGLLLRRRRLRI